MGGPLTERFLLVLNWDGAAAYRQADRHVWKIKSTDTEVAGFVRQVNDFTQVRSLYCSYIINISLYNTNDKMESTTQAPWNLQIL